MYFAVPFGLFNLLRHSQSEQAHWDPVIDNFFLDQNGYIQFGKSPKILWTSINRWNSTLQTPPSYRLYTEFGLKHYFLAFWVVTIIQFIVVFLVKLKISVPFVRMCLIDKIVHIMENINVYQCTEDWDHRLGTAEDHIKRMNKNFREYVALAVVNYLSNIVLLVPLSILGNLYILTSFIDFWFVIVFRHIRIKYLWETWFFVQHYWCFARRKSSLQPCYHIHLFLCVLLDNAHWIGIGILLPV